MNQIAQRIGATEPVAVSTYKLRHSDTLKCQVLTHAQKSLPIAVQSKLLGENALLPILRGV